MAINLNLNSMNVDDSGRISFSGLNSGIDFRAAVDAIIAAKRIPVDTLETRITENDDKLLALNELKSRLNVLRESLAKLYGKLSVGFADNVFQAKQGFSSTSRIDGGVASSAANLLGMTVANSAAAGTHTIEVLRTATSHKVSSDSVTSLSATLGFADGDNFTINGQTVTVSSGDSLLDVRDRINNANTGATATGVSASVVTVSATEHYLILTGDDAATTIALADTTNTPLGTIGVLNGAAIKNELQAAQTAQFYVDGLLDTSNTAYESALQSAATATVATTGTIDFGAPGSINYTAGDDLNAIAANINLNVAGVTAAVVTDGAGARLDITSGAAFTMTEAGGGALLTELGIDNSRLMAERDSNTVSDLFDGVTLSLFQAEQGTTIRVDIENDINQVKTAITTFVESYNDLRTYVNSQRRMDEGSPVQADDSGVLFSSQALRQADQLARIFGEGASGVNGAFQVLGQIGVNLVDNRAVVDPVLSNTLEIDEAKLDEAILNNLDDVRRLFTFDFSASDPRVSVLSFNQNAVYNSAGYTLNVASSGTYTVPPGPGATNQISYSENFDDASYTPTNATVTADDAALDPAGGTAADALTLDTTTGLHYVETSALAVTAGQTYTYSVYVKQGSTDQVTLDLAGSGITGTDASATFDLVGGTLVDVGTDLNGATITADANGFYRISVTATADATGSVTIKNQASDSGLGDNFLGDGSDAIYLYGSQFEDTTALAPQPLIAFATTETTIVSNVDLAPDGTGNGDRIDASINNLVHSIDSTTAINTTTGEQYTYTVYLKQGTQTTAQISLSDVGAAFAAGTTANFDLAGGTVTGVGAGTDSATIEASANGYYRVTLTATAAATTATSVATISPNDGAAYIGTGAGSSDLFFYEPTVVDTSTTAPTAYEQTGIFVGTPNQVISANINGPADGSDDGSASVNGGIVTVNTGGAKGLVFATTGFSAATAIQIDFTRGVGAQMFFAIDDMLDFQDGIVANEIESLDDANAFSQDRIEGMLERIEIRRRDLISRFIRMETALVTLNRILEGVRTDANAMFGNK